MTDASPARSVSFWRLGLPLALQAALIVALPAQAIYTHLTGRTVVLKTAPVDPYDLMRGYSVTLNYDISRSDALKSLPGWKAIPPGRYGSLPESTTLYVILEQPKGDNPTKPQAWKPVQVSTRLPDNLPANQVALKGRMNYSRIEYGLETYYMPEDRRDEVNLDINRAQRDRNRPALVEVKINQQGNAVPIQVWVGDRAYRF